MKEENDFKSSVDGYSQEDGKGSGERRYQRRDKRASFSKKQCYFKKNGIREIDFKDVGLLRRFIGKSGKILPKKFTGVSPRAQRVLAVAIKRARYMALLPYTGEMGYLDFNLPRRARENDGEHESFHRRRREGDSSFEEERKSMEEGHLEA